jgi:glycosyltransferase involved in cell wall biosynthesis
MRVTQVLCAAGPVDAVTNQGLAYRRLFAEWGWDGTDYAAVVAPGMPRGSVKPLTRLPARERDAVVVHYSGYARGLPELLRDSRHSLLISHNVTPARYFWDHQPVEAVRCELARRQLAEIGAAASRLAAVSAYNAAELAELSDGRDVEVLPVLFEPERLGPGLTAPLEPPEGPARIVFVGRLAPHKRQDLVIAAFARLRRRRPDAELVLVGTPMTAQYLEALQRLAAELAPDAVRFETGLDREQLAARYRSAHAFLCLSEHEGFCIPLLEAFHFGVPVLARDAGAIREVAGDAAVLLSRSDDVGVVAEALELTLADAELRATLRRRGTARLAQFSRARVAARVREVISELAVAA